MPRAVLTISSRNYSSWSLRGWLLCKLAGLDVGEEMVSIDSPGQRAELLLLSPSVLVPRLTHEGASVWDTLAIAEYLAETFPEAGLYPADKLARAHCRSVSGEIHSGFYNLRSALPMNLKARHDSFRLFTGAKSDIERVQAIWRDCLERYGGPWLFGAKPGVADAMFAPVATRFVTYAIPLDPVCGAYVKTITDWPLMREWTRAALAEPEEVEELDAEF
ncbi:MULTISPECIES: glutathione S-transferase [unclassified Sphingomonas]|uniref:glutathione S-transferase n=1 Tax=unclassified Sphingomonas TaxID=196159 RepID=UPI0006F2A8AA|nr:MULTISPECIES: glutathione S-transferase [unclassified Sphingomonas]KQX25714.1 glutathione S-transferase [Sphingomonas sp. Root1294]KQY66703.1 glutathione S-transferase [Sphingomonas sp. Root50]KRB90194.1 glutathione S-transferase [Sphingomonas sp. Root720]